jgi:glutamyl-tRNA reductase
MSLDIVGLSHRTASIETRERLAFGRGELPGALADLLESGTVSEAVVLSTCNRTEFCVSGAEEGRIVRTLGEMMARRAAEPADLFLPQLYVRRGPDAARHLFRVTAGLDSMVLGEPQIQGQVKEAYTIACETAVAGGRAVGPVLNRAFQSAFCVGGRVRSETGIGAGAASVATAAVELAKKIYGTLRDRRALVLGAGEMSEATLECLRAEGVQSTVVANRTYARARELAERLGGRAIDFDDALAHLAEVDIVVASTAAPHPILSARRVREVLPDGAPRPLCILDLAVPRDVEPAVGELDNVFLYNVDDLQQVVGTTLGRREAELPRAEAIVDEGVREFWAWYTSLAVVPTIRDLRTRGDGVRRSEVERLLRRMPHLSDADRGQIEAMTRAMLNKLLHTPTVRLREAAGNGRGAPALDTVRYLFELDDPALRAEGSPETEGLDSCEKFS